MYVRERTYSYCVHLQHDCTYINKVVPVIGHVVENAADGPDVTLAVVPGKKSFEKEEEEEEGENRMHIGMEREPEDTTRQTRKPFLYPKVGGDPGVLVR